MGTLSHFAALRLLATLAALLLVVACAENPMGSDREGLTESRELAIQPGRGWFETQRLSVIGDVGFGTAIAMSATDAVVTSSDHRVHAFTLSESGWGNPRELAIDAVLDPTDRLSVSISGDTLVVGAPSTRSGTSSAFVFTKTASGWAPAPTEPLRSPSQNVQFGAAVAIDGDLIVVGSPVEQSAYVFARVGQRWLQQKQLFASDNPLTPYRNGYGAAVAIAGRTVVVGAPESGAPDPYTQAGKAYVYRASSDLSARWAETILLPSTRKTGSLFGATVAILQSVVLVGAPSEWRSKAGAVYSFTNYGATRSPQELTSASTDPDEFGTSLASSNGRAVVGARYLSTSAARRPGAAYVFARSSDGWASEQAIVPEPAAELFGNAVATSGDTILIGAPDATPNGAVYVQRLLGAAGSACLENGDCGHGHCISGVCCESACEGACEECSRGACLPVASGELGTPACGSYVCDGASGSCPERCASHGDCDETHYCHREACAEKSEEGATCAGPEECLSGNCVERKCTGTLPNGTRCDSGSDCARGHCVDDVCCDDACTGQCEACNVAGHEGECTPVEDEPHGTRPACDGDGPECNGHCNGEASDACEYPTSAKECGSVCEDGAETVSVCNGQGECIANPARRCERFACNESETRCVDHCEADGDCSGDFRCWSDEQCRPGKSCVSNHESLSAPGDGKPTECSPFACSRAQGDCVTRCTSGNDCAAPYACRSGNCVPLSGDDEGCGCRIALRSTDVRWPLASCLGLLAIAWRRARRNAPVRRSRG